MPGLADTRAVETSGGGSLIDAMEAVTRLEQVSKRYADRLVLDAVSLEVLPEAHLALLGPSGSGKSTLLRIIAGLEIPDTGAVSVHGQPVSADGQILIPPHQRGLSLVFQDLGLWPGLTVLENVQLGLAGTRLSRRERAERAREMLAACRIEGLAREKPARLSGGEQQRTALARALALRPRLLLLDEPFSGLDLELKRHFYDEIRRLAGAFAATCLLVSHDPMEATAFCSHAAVLEGGRIQERGPLTALLSNPASATLRAFVDQLPGGRNRSGGA